MESQACDEPMEIVDSVSLISETMDIHQTGDSVVPTRQNVHGTVEHQFQTPDRPLTAVYLPSSQCSLASDPKASPAPSDDMVIESDIEDDSDTQFLYQLFLKNPTRPPPFHKINMESVRAMMGRFNLLTAKPTRPTGECRFYHHVINKDDLYQDNIPPKDFVKSLIRRKEEKEKLKKEKRKAKLEKAEQKSVSVKNEDGTEQLTDVQPPVEDLIDLDEEDQDSDDEMLDDRSASDLPPNYDQWLWEINQASLFLAKGHSPDIEPKKDFRFKNMGEFKMQVFGQINIELALQLSKTFETDHPQHNGSIRSATIVGATNNLVHIVCEFPRDPPDPYAQPPLRFGQMLCLQVTDDQGIDLSHIFTVIKTQCELDENKELVQMVECLGNKDPDINFAGRPCTVKYLCDAQSWLTRARVLYNFKPKVNYVHQQLLKPVLTSFPGVINADISRETQDHFDRHRRTFFLNCIQKSIDTLQLNNHHSRKTARFVAFDDKSDEQLTILTMAIIHQIIKLEKKLEKMKQGILPSTVKAETSEPDYVEPITDTKIRLVLTSPNRSQLDLIRDQLSSADTRVFDVGGGKYPTELRIDQYAYKLMHSEQSTLTTDSEGRARIKFEADILHRTNTLELAKEFLLARIKRKPWTKPDNVDPALEADMHLEIIQKRRRALIELFRVSDVILGTVDELLNDELVYDLALSPEVGFYIDAIIVHDASIVDESNMLSLLQFNSQKVLLIGNSGKLDQIKCSSLFRRMVRLYDRERDKITSESHCSVLSSFNPIRRRYGTPSTTQQKSESIKWFEDLTRETNEPPVPSPSNGGPDFRPTLTDPSSDIDGRNNRPRPGPLGPQRGYRPGPANRGNRGNYHGRNGPAPLTNGILKQPVKRSGEPSSKLIKTVKPGPISKTKPKSFAPTTNGNTREQPLHSPAVAVTASPTKPSTSTEKDPPESPSPSKKMIPRGRPTRPHGWKPPRRPDRPSPHKESTA